MCITDRRQEAKSIDFNQMATFRAKLCGKGIRQSLLCTKTNGQNSFDAHVYREELFFSLFFLLVLFFFELGLASLEISKRKKINIIHIGIRSLIIGDFVASTFGIF